MAELSHSPYVTYLAAVMEAMSFHFTTKCVASSFTVLDEPYPLTTYEANPSSTRAAAYQGRGCVKGRVDWRQDVKLSSRNYGKARLMPSLTSDLETRT